MMWFVVQEQYVILSVYAKPNARKSAIVKVADDALHVAIHAKPQEGEANKALCVYLAKILGLPKSRVVLLKGETSRYKRVQVPLTVSVQQFIDSYIDSTPRKPG